MIARLGLLMVLLSCRSFASHLPVEGKLGPPPEQSSADDWRHSKPSDEAASDQHGDYWWFQFRIGSADPLGNAADEAAIKAAIKASVPSSIPPVLRWASDTDIVVLSACRTHASSSKPSRCLYVFQKHHRKWRLTHHYPYYSGPTTF